MNADPWFVEQVVALMDNAAREWSGSSSSLPPQEFVAERVAAAFHPVGLECAISHLPDVDPPCGHRVVYAFGDEMS